MFPLGATGVIVPIAGYVFFFRVVPWIGRGFKSMSDKKDVNVQLQGVSMAASAGIGVTARVKHSFSQQHLAAATLFAGEAQEWENATHQPDETRLSKHRALVTSAILSAVAFLEASINELYHAVINREVLPPLPSERFQELWEIADGEKFPILKKYQVALTLADKQCFVKGTQPYQDADSLIKLRDSLVHYKPEWEDEAGQHQKLESRLHGKFALNPYFPTATLWFPHRCLGAGCAQWSVAAARAFSDEFCDRLGIPRRPA